MAKTTDIADSCDRLTETIDTLTSAVSDRLHTGDIDDPDNAFMLTKLLTMVGTAAKALDSTVTSATKLSDYHDRRSKRASKGISPGQLSLLSDAELLSLLSNTSP